MKKKSNSKSKRCSLISQINEIQFQIGEFFRYGQIEIATSLILLNELEILKSYAEKK